MRVRTLSELDKRLKKAQELLNMADKQQTIIYLECIDGETLSVVSADETKHFNGTDIEAVKQYIEGLNPFLIVSDIDGHVIKDSTAWLYEMDSLEEGSPAHKVFLDHTVTKDEFNEIYPDGYKPTRQPQDSYYLS